MSYKLVNGKKIFLTNEEVVKIKEEEALLAKEAIFQQRQIAYGDAGSQLGMLFDELKETGSISLNGEWASHITQVKKSIPKGDV